MSALTRVELSGHLGSRGARRTLVGEHVATRWETRQLDPTLTSTSFRARLILPSGDTLELGDDHVTAGPRRTWTTVAVCAAPGRYVVAAELVSGGDTVAHAERSWTALTPAVAGTSLSPMPSTLHGWVDVNLDPSRVLTTPSTVVAHVHPVRFDGRIDRTAQARLWALRPDGSTVMVPLQRRRTGWAAPISVDQAGTWRFRAEAIDPAGNLGSVAETAFSAGLPARSFAIWPAVRDIAPGDVALWGGTPVTVLLETSPGAASAALAFTTQPVGLVAGAVGVGPILATVALPAAELRVDHVDLPLHQRTETLPAVVVNDAPGSVVAHLIKTTVPAQRTITALPVGACAKAEAAPIDVAAHAVAHAGWTVETVTIAGMLIELETRAAIAVARVTPIEPWLRAVPQGSPLVPLTPAHMTSSTGPVGIVAHPFNWPMPLGAVAQPVEATLIATTTTPVVLTDTPGDVVLTSIRTISAPQRTLTAVPVTAAGYTHPASAVLAAQPLTARHMSGASTIPAVLAAQPVAAVLARTITPAVFVTGAVSPAWTVHGHVDTADLTAQPGEYGPAPVVPIIPAAAALSAELVATEARANAIPATVMVYGTIGSPGVPALPAAGQLTSGQTGPVLVASIAQPAALAASGAVPGYTAETFAGVAGAVFAAGDVRAAIAPSATPAVAAVVAVTPGVGVPAPPAAAAAQAVAVAAALTVGAQASAGYTAPPLNAALLAPAGPITSVLAAQPLAAAATAPAVPANLAVIGVIGASGPVLAAAGAALAAQPVTVAITPAVAQPAPATLTAAQPVAARVDTVTAAGAALDAVPQPPRALLTPAAGTFTAAPPAGHVPSVAVAPALATFTTPAATLSGASSTAAAAFTAVPAGAHLAPTLPPATLTLLGTIGSPGFPLTTVPAALSAVPAAARLAPAPAPALLTANLLNPAARLDVALPALARVLAAQALPSVMFTALGAVQLTGQARPVGTAVPLSPAAGAFTARAVPLWVPVSPASPTFSPVPLVGRLSPTGPVAVGSFAAGVVAASLPSAWASTRSRNAGITWSLTVPATDAENCAPAGTAGGLTKSTQYESYWQIGGTSVTGTITISGTCSAGHAAMNFHLVRDGNYGFYSTLVNVSVSSGYVLNGTGAFSLSFAAVAGTDLTNSFFYMAHSPGTESTISNLTVTR